MRSIPLLVAAALVLLAAAPAGGQPSDPNLGRSLAATCANCHGTNGVSAGEVVSLAGKPKDEIVRKMQDFKTGRCRARSCRSSRRATPTSRSTSSPPGSRRNKRSEDDRP